MIPRGVYTKGLISIPRPELCAADALAQAVLQVLDDLRGEVSLQDICLFTDSEDVMGWLTNPTETFPRYITNRRDRMCKITDPSQWRWIPGSFNPADIGTRPISVDKLLNSRWTKSAEFLYYEPVVIPCEPKEKIGKDLGQPVPSLALSLSAFAYSPLEPVKGVVTWDGLLDGVKKEHGLGTSEATTHLLRLMQRPMIVASRG